MRAYRVAARGLEHVYFAAPTRGAARAMAARALVEAGRYRNFGEAVRRLSAVRAPEHDAQAASVVRGSFSPPPPPPVRFMPLSELVFTIHVGRQLAREVRS